MPGINTGARQNPFGYCTTERQVLRALVEVDGIAHYAERLLDHAEERLEQLRGINEAAQTAASFAKRLAELTTIQVRIADDPDGGQGVAADPLKED